MLLRNYKFRLYPSKSQLKVFELTLNLCRQLYNAALEERISAWKKKKKSLNRYVQCEELPELKQICPEYTKVYAQTLQAVLSRLDKAYQNFFRRVKSGQTPGFPRFKGKDRYDSFAYPQQGFSIDEKAKKLTLSKIGQIKIKAWRTLPSKPKNVTLKKEADGWYAVLCCELEPIVLPKTSKAIGIDVGLTSLVTCSDGQILGNLADLKKDELALRKIQRRLSRKKKGSMRRAHSRSLFAKKNQSLSRKRVHALHGISKKLIAENDLIALEDLAINQMASKKKGKTTKSVLIKKQETGLRRNIHQAAWGTLRAQLIYKAEEAGRKVVLVDPRNTTQLCSACGELVPKTLRDRVHDCPKCGLVLGRDHNAAINILQRAIQVQRGDSGSKSGSMKRKVLSKKSDTFARVSTF